MAARGDENDEQSVIYNSCDSLKYFNWIYGISLLNSRVWLLCRVTSIKSTKGHGVSELVS